MNILLFFISSSFATIFYIFFRMSLGQKVYLGGQEYSIGITSISGNLLIETVIFLVLGTLMFIIFSNFSFFKKKENNTNKENFIEKESIFSQVRVSDFIKEHLYYIGFILFYLSIYIILKSFGLSDFSYFIFILNIIIGILFFLTNKAELFRDFIKINTILFSLYYICLYLYLLFFSNQGVIFIDIVNTVFILSFFVITVYSDSKILKRKDSDNAIILYFFLYSFIICTYYIKELFDYPAKEFLNIIVIISCLFNLIIYFFLQKLTFLKNSKYILRTLAILFSYVSILFGAIILVEKISGITPEKILAFFILLYSLFFNYYIHHKFQNYISFGFSLLTAFFLIYLSVSNFCEYKELDFIKWEIIITFFSSFTVISITYIYKMKYIYDYIFLHYYAYIINILGIIYYFYNAKFIILNFGIILLISSILIFFSYFKLKKLK